MSCSNYRCLQMTNNNVGAVAAGSFMPLGTITRSIADNNCSLPRPFEVTTSGADTVLLTKTGVYDVLYSATVVAGAAGILTLALFVGDEQVYAVSATVASGATATLTLPYDLRVFGNCKSMPGNCPLPVRVQLQTVGITGGTGNLRIGSCVNGN